MATRTTSRSTTSPAAATKTAAAQPAKAAKTATETPKAAKTAAETPKAAKTAAETPETAATPRVKAASSEAATPPAKSTKKEAAVAETATQIDPEQRRQYVAEAAYFIAERRGFLGGTDHDDWAEAEALIDRMLAGDTKH